MNCALVNQRLEKKFESKEALELSVKQMYNTAMDKRKKLSEKNEQALREQACRGRATA